jgi:hypothetical protein
LLAAGFHIGPLLIRTPPAGTAGAVNGDGLRGLGDLVGELLGLGDGDVLAVGDPVPVAEAVGDAEPVTRCVVLECAAVAASAPGGEPASGSSTTPSTIVSMPVTAQARGASAPRADRADIKLLLGY